MVYLIHFDKPFKGVQHYIGWSRDTETFEKRIACHRSGHGSCLMRAVTEAEIGWRVVRTWGDKDGNFERKLKNQKNSKRFCPICNPKNYKTRGMD